MHQLLMHSLRLLPLILGLARAKGVEPLQKDRSCRTTIKDEVEGTIDYPGNGGNYPNNAKCRWDVTVSGGKQVDVTFIRFGTADGWDTLTVKNGPKGATIGIFYGQDLPKAFITSSNQLYLFFKSNSMNTDIGFMIKWKTFDAETMNQCMANRTDSSELWLKIDQSEGTIGTKIDDMGNEIDTKLVNLVAEQGTIGTKIDGMGNDLDTELANLRGVQGTIGTKVDDMGNEIGTKLVNLAADQGAIGTKIDDMGNELVATLANLTGGQGTIGSKLDDMGNEIDTKLVNLVADQGTIGTKIEDMGNELVAKLANLTGGQGTIGSRVDGMGNDLDAKLVDVQGTIASRVDDMGNYLGAKLVDVQGTIGTQVDDMGNDLGGKLDNVVTGQGTIGSLVDDMGNDLGAKLVDVQGTIGTQVDDMGNDLGGKLDNVVTGQGSMESKMTEILRKLDNLLENAPQTEQDCISLGGETIIGDICLMFSTETRNYADAEEACAVFEGGRLAAISQDPLLVSAYVETNYNSINFWVGASDIETEGSWKWTNGQAMDNNFPWHTGEPNGGTNENCLHFANQYFNDLGCHGVLRYVCDIGNGNFKGTKNVVLTKQNKLPESIMVNGSDFENGENITGVTSRPSTLSGDMTSGKVDHMLSSAEGSTSMSEEGEEVEVKEVMEKKMEVTPE